MLKNEKIFFFEKVNIFNLLFIVLFRILFFNKKFFYRNLSQEIKKSFVLKIVHILKLKHLNYKTVGYEKFFKDFSKNNVELTNAVLQKLKKNKSYKNLIHYYNLEEKNIEIFDIFLSKSLAGNYLTEGYSSLNLLKHTFGNKKKIFYFPENLGNFLISKEYSSLNIKPIFTLLLIKNVMKLLINLFIFKNNKINKNNKFKVLYCPHRGMYYGNSYKKNFIFKNIYNKKFNNQEILVADYPQKCELTKRYYKRFGISQIDFFDFKKIKFLNIISFLLKNRELDKSNLYHLFFFINNFNDIENCIKFLNNFKNLKVAVFSYDINANISLILSSNILKIKTLSFQERSGAYFYTPYMYFDEYYISGNRMKKIFFNNYYKFKKLTVAALPRSTLIKNIKVNNLDRNIICLPPPMLDELNRINYGNIFSEKTINDFYEIILKLSKIFPNYNFLIKNKFSEKNILSLQFLKKINDLNINNIKILEDKKRNSLYKLINNAQIVFGNYSSFFDECFSANKQTLIYDRDFIAFEHPFKFTNIYCKNFFEVENKLDLMISNKFLLDEKTLEIKENYFPNPSNGNNDVYSLIISRVNDIIFENDKL